MNGAEFRCKREFLGLSAGWLARKLDIETRTVQRWETMEKVPPKGVEAIEYLYSAAARSVSVIAVNQLKRKADNSDIGPLVIPSGENDLPASWHRMIAMRVAERTGQSITTA